MSSNAVNMIEGEEAIKRFRLKVLIQGIRLEMAGIRMTRKAPTAYSILKREFGFKGDKFQVYMQAAKLWESMGGVDV